MHQKEHFGRLIKGALLIAGTSIGGGMLALPVEMALGGFVPSIFIYFLTWWLMASTGLLLLEVSIWFKGEANLVTMAEKTLGTFGKAAAWALYLFLFYMLTLAYVTGCGGLLRSAFPELVSESIAPFAFVAFFGPFVFAGARIVSRLNLFMMAGLFFFYFLFVWLGASQIQPELLTRMDWRLSLIGLPVAFTAFAYQGIVPTIAHYFKYEARPARYAILIGSGLPFFAYVIWQALIMGIIPVEGAGGLQEAMLKGQNAVVPLKNFLHDGRIYIVGQFFSFFALVTSFFGVAIGLQDFLADGLQVKKTAKGRFFLCLAIFIPPLLVTFYDPNVFLIALSLAGGIGCALLLGLMPVLMVFSGRYRLGIKGPYQFFGGKPLLIALAVFVILELLLQVAVQLGLTTWMSPL